MQSGIDWLSVSPSVAQAGTTGVSVIPLTISIKGGFFQVLDYLNRLEDLGRLVIVDAINAERRRQPTPYGRRGGAERATDARGDAHRPHVHDGRAAAAPRAARRRADDGHDRLDAARERELQRDTTPTTAQVN